MNKIRLWWQEQNAHPIKRWFWRLAIFCLIFGMGYCSASKCGSDNHVPEVEIVEEVE